MLTAHLPSGYLLGNFLDIKGQDTKSRRLMCAAAMIGALVPDLDMVYFHFVSFGRTHHHMLVSHWPLAWLAVGLPMILIIQIWGRRKLRNVAIAFFMGVALHLSLDSIAAPVFWLMPFAPGRVELVTVPARYSHWIISFLLHWTFLIELSIWAAAVMVWRRRRPHTS